MNFSPLIANVDMSAEAQAALMDSRNSEWISGDPVVLAFAACAVVTLVVGWALFFRKPKRTVGITPEEAAATLSSGKVSRRKQKRRFPTLAEKGGLPPLKTGN